MDVEHSYATTYCIHEYIYLYMHSWVDKCKHHTIHVYMQVSSIVMNTFIDMNACIYTHQCRWIKREEKRYKENRMQSAEENLPER